MIHDNIIVNFTFEILDPIELRNHSIMDISKKYCSDIRAANQRH